MSNPVICLFHADCLDGFTSYWVVKRIFRDAIGIPVGYQSGLPDCDFKGADVYVVDFSFPPDELRQIASVARSVVVIDHHKTAEENLRDFKADNVEITFDMSHSGAWLTWQHFHPEVKPHWLIDYTQDRDLWQWKLPYSREVSASLMSLDKSIDTWNCLAVSDLSHIQAEGKCLLRYQRKEVDALVKQAHTLHVAHYSVPAVNTQSLMSEVAGRLAEKAEFGVCYFRQQDGRWKYSLRSRGDDAVDVSEVARVYGGGGHANASGFCTDYLLGRGR